MAVLIIRLIGVSVGTLTWAGVNMLTGYGGQYFDLLLGSSSQS